jgi:DNA-binding NarL/FixJ family response regulator
MRDIMEESTVYQAILAEGDARRQRKTVVRLLRRGLSLDAIAEDLDLSLAEAKKIQLSESL